MSLNVKVGRCETVSLKPNQAELASRLELALPDDLDVANSLTFHSGKQNLLAEIARQPQQSEFGHLVENSRGSQPGGRVVFPGVFALLVVPTLVSVSSIHGIGLFASERVEKGERVWVFDPRFDLTFVPEEIPGLPRFIQALLATHSFLCNTNGVRVISMDNDRWTNHSPEPNSRLIKDDSEWGYHFSAARTICAGEEITNDYREFCDDIRDIPEHDYLHTETQRPEL